MALLHGFSHRRIWRLHRCRLDALDPNATSMEPAGVGWPHPNQPVLIRRMPLQVSSP
jgi:hypothetical protein